MHLTRAHTSFDNYRLHMVLVPLYTTQHNTIYATKATTAKPNTNQILNQEQSVVSVMEKLTK